jgi:hypothetical protein
MSHQSITAVLPLILLFGAKTATADLPPGRPVGEETRRWLELQRSGTAASTTRQTVSGPIADAIYQRYVDSFKHPIPEFYQSKQDGDSGVSSK